VYGENGSDFLRKKLGISGGVGYCVVSMNNESPPISLRVERKKLCENIHMVILGIKCVAFWKCVERMKSQWIHAMVTIIFGFWMVCFGLSGDCSSARSQICSWYVER
jgi:hypothetical protein